MSERTEIVKTCDVCGKRVSDEGVEYLYMPTRHCDSEEHPFHHWFKLDRIDGARSSWILCSVPCLTKLANDGPGSPPKETLL